MIEPESRFLITGAAGFIGFHVAKRLIEAGHRVTGFDSLTDFADEGLKARRLAILAKDKRFHHCQGDLTNEVQVRNVFRQFSPHYVIHLGGQAGVRESYHNPARSVSSNVMGTMNILETAARVHRPKHIVFASSSSVYGMNSGPQGVQTESTPLDRPQSIYAASKAGAEALAHAYSLLYMMHVTAMRFFTVYGPMGRPDMSVNLFARNIKLGAAIVVNGAGDQRRDFTYIDDTVEAIIRLIDPPVMPMFFRPINIGKGSTSSVLEIIKTMSEIIGRRPKIVHGPAFPDDMFVTCADPTALAALTGFTPGISLRDGLERYIAWHDSYYGADMSGAHAAQ
jgi:UDP-glucuronate 4-epimerase